MTRQQLSERIRALWCEEMRDFNLRNKGLPGNWGTRHIVKWDGGRDDKGSSFTPVWPKIAQFCIQHDLEPEILVRALFYRQANTPRPNQAHGPYALDTYIAYTQSRTKLDQKSQIIYEFESQKARVVAETVRLKKYHRLEEQMAWRSVIASRDQPLSPLFRYCVCMNQKWHDMSVDYLDAARRQYKRDSKLYDEVWGDWIPQQLKEGE